MSRVHNRAAPSGPAHPEIVRDSTCAVVGDLHVEVQNEELEEREGVLAVRAYLWKETETQKGILICARGAMIKSIGTAARRELERELG